MICTTKRLGSFGVLILVVAVGCSPGAREDRTITFSSDGRSVGFQHGDAGVFLNNIQAGSAEQIYELESGEIVASTPQFSGDDHIVFAVARPLESDQELTRDTRMWDAAPSGRQYFPGATEYKCMYRPKGAGEAEELFVARCDHTGYVAANLAIRWHPSGKAIWYIDTTDGGQVAVFEYRLADQSRRRITPFESAALVFDFSPAGTLASCASLGTANGVVQFCSLDDEVWQELPDSGLAGPPDADWLEQLRASLPKIDSREESCVYKTRSRVRESAEPNQTSWNTELILFEFQSKQPKVLHDAFRDIRDIHWHPTDALIAFVDSQNNLSLLPTNRPGDAEQAIESKAVASNVRSFAGFSSNGSWVAYTRAEQLASTKSTDLFTPIAESRDELLFSRIDTTASPADVSAGQASIDSMRLTFPHWSPKEAKLSAWATFSPTHRSQLSRLIPWTLAAGDPAIVLDAETGKVTWMPINPTEEAQVGHYYLLQHEQAQAWKWYEKSIGDRPPMPPIKLSSLQLLGNQMQMIQDSTFFEFICLRRLGKHEAATERLTRFHKHFVLDHDDLVQFASPASAGDAASAAQEEAAGKLTSRISKSALAVLKASFITEVYLSLDAAEEGVEFFTDQAKASLTPWEALANRLCLSHLILASGQADAYAEFVLTQLVPAYDAVNQPGNRPTSLNSSSLADTWPSLEQAFARTATASAMLPLLSEELTARLAPENHGQLVARLEALVAGSTDQMRTRFLTRVLASVCANQVEQQTDGTGETLDPLSPEAAQQAAWLEQLEENSVWTIVQPK